MSEPTKEILLQFVKTTKGTIVYGNEELGHHYFPKEWFAANVSKNQPKAVAVTIRPITE